MEVKIVLGTLFGDEGKGNTVQWLCKKAIAEGKKPIVIRYSGGPQAGHTIRHNGVTHVCSSYGSGVLLGVPTLYMGGLIDPLCIAKEKEVLESKGVKVPPLYVEHDVPLITPYDVADQQKWAEDNPNRTCGKGVMSAVLRDSSSAIEPTVAADIMNRASIRNILHAVKCYYSDKGKNFDVNSKVLDEWVKAAASLGEFVELHSFLGYDVLIFEGTQGLLLDVQNGYYPYTTSTKVGLNGIPKEYLYDAEVYLVSRTYLTRHGEMGKYEKHWFEGRKITIPGSKLETNVYNNFQGDFITGRYHPEPFICAIERHHLDNLQKKFGLEMNLVVTHTDVVTEEMKFHRTLPAITVQMIQEVFEGHNVTIQNVYTSDSPDSNFKLYASKIN